MLRKKLDNISNYMEEMSLYCSKESEINRPPPTHWIQVIFSGGYLDPENFPDISSGFKFNAFLWIPLGFHKVVPPSL